MDVIVKKGNGELEAFDRSKLEESLHRSGASNTLVDEIVASIESTLQPGMTTKSIYHHAFELLKEHADTPVAARYSLRRAVMDLGPSGFPFESLIGEIFTVQGYTTKTGVTLQGKCIEHEVDVVAEKDNKLVFVEAKFHNSSGFKTDVKITLYIQARAEDLLETRCGGKLHANVHPEFWLMTNTKFSRNAIVYGECVGLKLVGWNYPHKGNLQDMIEEAGLHPLTCLTTLSKNDKEQLFKKGLVLCRNIKGKPDTLRDLGISHQKTEAVMHEAQMLCVPQV